MKKKYSVLILLCLCISFATAQTKSNQNRNKDNYNCLAEGTQILMANEEMTNIENIRKGNTVIVFDPVKLVYTTRQVKNIKRYAHARVYRLTLKDGTQIVTTEGYPFLTPDGWKSLSPDKTMTNEKYDEVWEYGIGDDIYIYDTDLGSTSKLVMIEGIIETTRTYSIELDGEGAFVANYMLVGQE